MNPSSIKPMMKLNNKKALTFAELLIAMALAVTLIGSTLGAFMLVKQVSAKSIVETSLQRDADLIIMKIIKGKRESGIMFRLSEAVSYSIPAISELHFVGTDGIERWYHLNSGSTSVLYHHPGFTAQEEVIYTAPQGATITLRFWTPSGTVYSGISVGIDVAVSKTLQGKNLSGSVTTMINIRNHPS